MNLLQSFMGCMYPGSIRTESIESMDREYADCRYQAANIDDSEQEISRGELQLTDRELIYVGPSGSPTRWPICYLRKYGCTKENDIFMFEAGRRCPTGSAIFGFRLNRASELVKRLKEVIENLAANETNTLDSQVNLMQVEGQDLRPLSNPLSYARIDFDTTKALNDTAQAHAASRVR